jgi:transcriptional regulator
MTQPEGMTQPEEDQVRVIRARAEDGWTQEHIAADFDMSRGNVSKVINRKVYANVD